MRRKCCQATNSAGEQADTARGGWVHLPARGQTVGVNHLVREIIDGAVQPLSRRVVRATGLNLQARTWGHGNEQASVVASHRADCSGVVEAEVHIICSIAAIRTEIASGIRDSERSARTHGCTQVFGDRHLDVTRKERSARVWLRRQGNVAAVPVLKVSKAGELVRDCLRKWEQPKHNAQGAHFQEHQKNSGGGAPR